MRRRTFLTGVTRLTGGAMAAPLFASAAGASSGLSKTPSQAEGPYYPVRFGDDTDANLMRVGNGPAPEGEPLALSGRVLSTDGVPIAGARVEIWQCDAQGRYDHPRAPSHARFDRTFQGFGRTESDADGRYTFITMVPVPYTGRPPHIHVKVYRDGREVLTTQLYIKDHPENGADGVLASLFFPSQEKLLMDLQPTEIDGMAGREAVFDFVV